MIYIQNKLFTTQTGFIKEDLCQAIEQAGKIISEQQSSSSTKTETKPKVEIHRHEEANVVFYTHG
jgi:hypothetical protein